MIVVDSSVLVAIMKAEPGADAFIDAMKARNDVCIPASCYVESAMVLSRISGGRQLLDEFLTEYDVVILACDERQARLAADAFERYGHGSGHPAGLSSGDCLAYAAAKAHEAPLLFKGADFGHTDVTRA